MSTPVFSTHPMEAWVEAGRASTAATLELAATASAAMASMWSATLMPLSGEAETSAVKDLPSNRGARDVQPTSHFSRSEPQGNSKAATGRSWYRAPYRSPFDPLFWMTPGHPVDHAGDFVSAMPGSWMMGGQGRATTSAASMAWLNPWSAWIGMLPSHSMTPASVDLSAGEIADQLGAAFAAYRTAGGHAAAQIVRVHAALQPRVGQDASAIMLPWPWSMFMGTDRRAKRA